MKKQIKLLALVFALGATSFTLKAQTNSSNGVHLGIKGGVNFSNMYTEDVDDNNVLTSFNAGLYVNLPITNFISIQPELLFSRKGSELTYNNAFADETGHYFV